MAVSPKLLSRVGNYLRGGPTEREESRTDALAAIESDLAGTDDIGVKEDLSSYLLDDIEFGELTPDEKRDAVVSKHEDNDNYEAWSPKGDPYSYELIAGDSRATSYIIATKDGKSVKIWADKMPEAFDKALSQSPSAITAGFGQGAPTNTLQPTRDRLGAEHEKYMAKLDARKQPSRTDAAPAGPTFGPEEAPEEELQVTSKSRTIGNAESEKAREYRQQIYSDELTPGMSDQNRMAAIKRQMTEGKA